MQSPAPTSRPLALAPMPWTPRRAPRGGGVLAEPDPEAQDTPQRQHEPDPLAGEQTWPTEEVRLSWCGVYAPSAACAIQMACGDSHQRWRSETHILQPRCTSSSLNAPRSSERQRQPLGAQGSHEAPLPTRPPGSWTGRTTTPTWRAWRRLLRGCRWRRRGGSRWTMQALMSCRWVQCQWSVLALFDGVHNRKMMWGQRARRILPPGLHARHSALLRWSRRCFRTRWTPRWGWLLGCALASTEGSRAGAAAHGCVVARCCFC